MSASCTLGVMPATDPGTGQDVSTGCPESSRRAFMRSPTAIMVRSSCLIFRSSMVSMTWDKICSFKAPTIPWSVPKITAPSLSWGGRSCLDHEFRPVTQNHAKAHFKGLIVILEGVHGPLVLPDVYGCQGLCCLLAHFRRNRPRAGFGFKGRVRQTVSSRQAAGPQGIHRQARPRHAGNPQLEVESGRNVERESAGGKRQGGSI
jgi:hypothetical protein